MDRETNHRTEPKASHIGLAIRTATCALLIVAGLTLLTPPVFHRMVRSDQAAGGDLQITPRVADFGDRVFGEGDSIRARFRLSNSRDRPLTIKAVETSCSCMATVAEGGKSFPLTLGPGASVDLMVSTIAMATRGLDQTYSALIKTEDNAETVRESTVAMSFHVFDALQAEPAAVRIFEAAADSQVRSSFVLFTRRDPREIGEPAIRVLGSERIHAQVRSSRSRDDGDRARLTRYVVDVSVEPGEEDVAGEIRVETPGESTMTIPVSCFFRRDIRFQPAVLLADVSAGDRFRGEVYQEFASDTWKGPRVFSKPPGSEVSIEPFDPHTNRIRVSLPARPDPGSRPGADSIILMSGDGHRTARIPIRYREEGSP